MRVLRAALVAVVSLGLMVSTMAAVSQPGSTDMLPGTSSVVTCPTELTGSFSANEVTLECAALPATPTPTLTPTIPATPAPTATPTATPVPTATATTTPAPTATATPAATPSMSMPPVAGCPSGTVLLEAQAWWLGEPVNTVFPGAHTHESMCFPYRQSVSGLIDLDVTILMHNNPGTYRSLRVHTQEQNNLAELTLNWTPGAVMAATKTVHLTLDTTKASHDGWQEIRFLGIVREPDGREQHVSTGFQLNIQNGNPESNYRNGEGLFTEARGWYTDANYTVARISSPIPTAPISGVWTPTIVLDEGAGGTPVAYSVATLDAGYHALNLGTVLVERNGSYRGTLSIDTSLLAPGPHKLTLRADSDMETGTNSGILVVPFVVADR